MLLLFYLYLLFKPTDIDPRATAGVLARQALPMGLMNELPTSKDPLPCDSELCRRRSWSIYVFDRMISISYGLRLGIPDEAMQVPLQSIMVHEYASSEGYQYTIVLQVSRHVICLRQLEASIVNSMHKHEIVARYQEMRHRIEDWYTQG